jgi:hypothetical protein
MIQGREGLIPVKRSDPNYRQATDCAKCGGTGIFPICSTCGGTGETDGETCKQCKGSGKSGYKRPPGREGFFTGEALARYMLDEAEPNQPGYDPAKRTYTSNLHVQPEFIECPRCMRTHPVTGQVSGPDDDCPRCGGSGRIKQRIAKDLDQNFQPFNPKKAKPKSKTLFGDPPSKADLQPWMTGPEATSFHHFNPIQFDQRDIYKRLVDLVWYLNYSYLALKKSEQLSPEEAEDLDQEEINELTKHRQLTIKKAQALFKRLEVMKPDDINGFREIMLASEDFIQEVKEHPELYGQQKSGKIVARRDDLVLRRCIDEKTALFCGNRATYNGQRETWCLHTPGNVRSYLRDGPIFFVEKQGLSYVGIHPASNQVRNTLNYALDDTREGNAISEEIAPLLVKFEGEIPTQRLRANANHLADIVDRLRLQARRGIQVQ